VRDSKQSHDSGMPASLCEGRWRAEMNMECWKARLTMDNFEGVLRQTHPNKNLSKKHLDL